MNEVTAYEPCAVSDQSLILEHYATVRICNIRICNRKDLWTTVNLHDELVHMWVLSQGGLPAACLTTVRTKSVSSSENMSLDCLTDLSSWVISLQTLVSLLCSFLRWISKQFLATKMLRIKAQIMTIRKTEHTAITGVCLISSLNGVLGILLSVRYRNLKPYFV